MTSNIQARKGNGLIDFICARERARRKRDLLEFMIYQRGKITWKRGQRA